MSLLDLSLVTQALTILIKENVRNSPAWTAANVLTVSPQPPDKLKGLRTIGFYLYHLRETAHTKAPGWSPDSTRPIRFSPVGLDLYYVLSAHSDINDLDQQIYAEQLMMGLAVKTLHDYPMLDDSTQVGAVTIFPPALQGSDNRLRLSLQPVAFNEAPQYWTGQQPLRLAAYYEVSATLLEPDEMTSRASRVLGYGAFAVQRGAPRLDGSRNDIQFTVPGESTPRMLTLQPAEVTYGGTLRLVGSRLGGALTSLVISQQRFAAPVQVNAVAWGVAATETELVATIQATAGTETVLPGIYGATAVVTIDRQLPDGSTRSFENRSNETPFTIAPLINQPVPAPVGGLWTITGQNFDPALLPDDQLQVFTGRERLERVTAGTPGAGTFRVMNPTTIRFRLPAAIVAGTVVPLRVVVNGAESAPFWIVAT